MGWDLPVDTMEGNQILLCLLKTKIDDKKGKGQISYLFVADGLLLQGGAKVMSTDLILALKYKTWYKW
jgi:hypothetical protein